MPKKKTTYESVRQIRRLIKHIPGAWVRGISYNSCWVGNHEKTNLAVQELVKILTDAGFECSLNGKPGTVGQYIIDVKTK